MLENFLFSQSVRTLSNILEFLVKFRQACLYYPALEISNCALVVHLHLLLEPFSFLLAWGTGSWLSGPSIPIELGKLFLLSRYARVRGYGLLAGGGRQARGKSAKQVTFIQDGDYALNVGN